MEVGGSNSMAKFPPESTKILEKLPILKKGEGTVTLTTQDYPAGMYYYSLIANGQIIATKQMILMK